MDKFDQFGYVCGWDLTFHIAFDCSSNALFLSWHFDDCGMCVFSIWIQNLSMASNQWTPYVCKLYIIHVFYPKDNWIGCLSECYFFLNRNWRWFLFIFLIVFCFLHKIAIKSMNDWSHLNSDQFKPEILWFSCAKINVLIIYH